MLNNHQKSEKKQDIYATKRHNQEAKNKETILSYTVQYKVSVCACLTVQSTPVRSSLLGPLDAGGREGWGGPRCWRPEREIAFLKTKKQQKKKLDSLSQ